MVSYATRKDVYNLGLSAQAFVVRARPYDAVDAATATVRLTAHGLTTGDAFTFVGTTGGSLPTSISAFTVYYAVVTSGDLFRVATSTGISPISSWVSAGSGWCVNVDQGARLDAHLAEAAARINECLTAHDPPILVDPITGLYPQVLVGLNARMAALAAVTSLQIENPAYRIAVDRLEAQRDWDGYGDKGAVAGTLLGDWKLGKPVQPRPTDSDNIQDNAARASSSCPMPWRSESM